MLHKRKSAHKQESGTFVAKTDAPDSFPMYALHAHTPHEIAR